MLYGMSLGATTADADDEDGDGAGAGVGTRLVPAGKRVSRLGCEKLWGVDFDFGAAAVLYCGGC
jgi:hypothetical protein